MEKPKNAMKAITLEMLMTRLATVSRYAEH